MPTARQFFSQPVYARQPGPACHSVVVQVPRAVNLADVRSNFDQLAAESPAMGAGRLWVERIEYSGVDPAAIPRREREARRPLAPAGPPVRSLVLSFGDGMADLVLVAHRGVCGRADLDTLATLMVRDPSARRPLPVPRLGSGPRFGSTTDEAREVRPATPPEWGLGDPERRGQIGVVPLELPKPAVSPRALLVAATGLVLSRYGEGEQPRLGLVTAQPAADDEIVALEIGVDRKDTASRYLQHVATLTGGVPVPDALPAAGLVLTRQTRTDHGPPVYYLPCVEPIFPLTIWYEEQPDGSMVGGCWFDEGWIAATVATQFARYLSHVTVQLAERLQDDPPLVEIDVMPVAEAPRVVAPGCTFPPAWPSTSPGAPAHTIHQAFRDVALRQLEDVAVSDELTALTYGELDERSDRLSRALRVAGVAAGDRVGVCLPPGVDLVVALLAVLKAGAAYVPLDLHSPPERLRYIAGDAGLSVVVAEPDGFPAGVGLRVLHPAALLEAPVSEPGDGAAAHGADDAAYVIYTSGSTGRPKGVVVPHRNVAALLAATQADMRLGPADVWTLFHSVAFDFSVWEIWGCLLTGGRLVVVPHWVSRAPEEFYELLHSEQVTVLNQTPSAFAQLLPIDRRVGADLALRLVVFGGEPLDPRMLQEWFSRHSQTECRMLNMYGITETTVHVTTHTVTPRDAEVGFSSVGAALPGWTISIHDEMGRLVPVGVAGEIYVGGAGVASHYLGRPELTAERFVTDPVSGERLYRSGDRGRLRPNGELDHLGRLDNQVKMRGYRIELDEIRSVLLDDPAVNAAVVVLGGEEAGDAALLRLDAYVVLNNGTSPDDVRRRAALMLPEYMVPSSITALPSFPLTVNGKLDTARLPAPGPRRTQDSTGDRSMPDGNGLAVTLLKVWREVLGTDVRPHDSFFELGGNSLQAVRLLAAMAAAGLPRLRPREIYLNPTVARLVAYLERLPG
jgi:amino acid adenylation domain-containing protein